MDIKCGNVLKKIIKNTYHKTLNLLGIRKRVLYFHANKMELTLLNLSERGFLVECGWIKSFKTEKIVDRDGNPLPWLTYSFIEFIKTRLDKKMKMFEYGSGYSTLFYSKYVRKVDGVEHDRNWYDFMKNKLPRNANILYKELEYSGEYSKAVQQTNEAYDIIIIDGQDRVNCMKNALKALSSRGVIILDDSQRERYYTGINYLLNKGFKRIDFWGISTGPLLSKRTTIFYREKNCFNI